jgi:hypothetical protein
VRWAGHAARMGDMLAGRPEGKRIEDLDVDRRIV